MTARLLDAEGGVETWFERDRFSGQVTIHEKHDCTANLRVNEVFRSNDGAVDPVLGKKVASIPVGVVGVWLAEAKVTWREFDTWEPSRRRRFLAQWANQREWYKVKTADRNI